MLVSTPESGYTVSWREWRIKATLNNLPSFSWMTRISCNWANRSLDVPQSPLVFQHTRYIAASIVCVDFAVCSM